MQRIEPEGGNVHPAAVNIVEQRFTVLQIFSYINP